jgi:hypothetical protein
MEDGARRYMTSALWEEKGEPMRLDSQQASLQLASPETTNAPDSPPRRFTA